MGWGMLGGKEPAQTRALFIPQIHAAYWGFNGEERQAGALPSQNSPSIWGDTQVHYRKPDQGCEEANPGGWGARGGASPSWVGGLREGFQEELMSMPK